MTTFRDLPSNLSSAVLPLAGTGLALVVGCGSGPVGESECVSAADCAPGFACIDGTCTLPLSTTDGSGDRADAGSAYGYDAGTSGYDAGTSRYDAGSSSYDAGHVDYDAGATDTGIGGICGQAACSAQGAECGQVVDECGAIVDCPSSCGSGYSCGTGAFANRCQCDPRSCDQLGAQCGTITDNCGVSRDCDAETGGCGARDRCNGSNRCECVPQDCSDVGAQCGNIDDGCGGTRNCGGCTFPERCGGAGVAANQCGCTVQGQQTSLTLFRTAQNVSGSGSREWNQLSDGVQLNQQGTNHLFYGGGSGGQCEDHPRSGETALLWLRNAGLSLPSDATIDGIEIQIDMKRNGFTPSLDEFVLYSRAFDSRNLARRLSLSTGYRRFTFGGGNDRWGISSADLTPEELNDGQFGVRLRMSATVECTQRAEPFVDAARVRVHYTVCR